MLFKGFDTVEKGGSHRILSLQSMLLEFGVTFLRRIVLAPRWIRYLILIAIDLTFSLVSIYTALGLYLSSLTSEPQLSFDHRLIFLIALVKAIAFLVSGLYLPMIRYFGLELFLRSAKAVLYSSGLLIVLFSWYHWFNLSGAFHFFKSIFIIDALLTLFLVISTRLTLRWLIQTLFGADTLAKRATRIIVYGAGTTGVQLVQALASDRAYKLIGFVDDNPALHHQQIQGLPVFAADELPRLRHQRPFDLVLLAMPSVDRAVIRKILKHLQTLQLAVKTVPNLSEILSGQIPITTIRNIDIGDLLGREEVPPDPQLLSLTITDKGILVTGAGGSIGSELCRQIAQQSPRCLVLYEQNEFALYTIDMELAETYPELHRIAILGSVTDEHLLSRVIARYGIETLYHAAAYKHVPLVEDNPIQGILNNVLGTLVTAQSAIQGGIRHFVLISTDKAVRPTSVMGASKRVAELIVQALAVQSPAPTCFAVVRFGNVMGSSGSVVPLFRQQIARGGPVTITHPDMTRYFMSIPEAARLVIQAGALASGGEVFLLDMGEPIRIYDLALQMVQLSGLVPNQDIAIQITRLRPGEKLHEELLVDKTQARSTRHPKIFFSREPMIPWERLQLLLESLLLKAFYQDHQAVILELQRLVPDYQSGTVPAVVPPSPPITNPAAPPGLEIPSVLAVALQQNPFSLDPFPKICIQPWSDPEL